MAKKASQIVILAYFLKQNGWDIMFNVKWDYPIKKAIYLPYHCY